MNVAGIFTQVIVSSASASALVAALLAVKAFAGKSHGAMFHDALWLIVVARLLMPFSVESGRGLPNPLSLARGASPAVVTSVMTGTAPPAPAGRSVPPAVSAAPVTVSGGLLDTLGAVWLAGIAAVAACYVVSALVFRFRLRRSKREPDANMRVIFAQCLADMRITRLVRLVYSETVRTPTLCGLLRPCVVMPCSPLSDSEARHVFVHELSHYKRKDNMRLLLLNVAQAVHWFNPVVWIALQRMRSDAEIACDAMTLRMSGQGERRSYGLLIVRLLESFSGQRRRLTSGTAMAGSIRFIAHRLSAIASGAKTRRVPSLVAAVVLAAACLVTVTCVSARNSELMGQIRTEREETQDNLGAFDQLLTIARFAKHNLDVVARASYLNANVQYQTEPTLQVARLAAQADREIPLLNDVVDLTVLLLSGTGDAVDLASQAVNGGLTDAELKSRIAALRARADLSSVDEAIELRKNWDLLQPAEGNVGIALHNVTELAELKNLRIEVTHNAVVLVKAQYILRNVGFNAQAVLNVARVAAYAHRTIPELEDLVALTVLTKGDPQPAVQLAAQLSMGTVTDADAATQIAVLKASADFKNLDEASQWSGAHR